MFDFTSVMGQIASNIAKKHELNWVSYITSECVTNVNWKTMYIKTKSHKMVKKGMSSKNKCKIL